MQRKSIFFILVAWASVFMALAILSAGSWQMVTASSHAMSDQFPALLGLLSNMALAGTGFLLVAALFVWAASALVAGQAGQPRDVEMIAHLAAFIMLGTLFVSGLTLSKSILLLPMLLVIIHVLSVLATVALGAGDEGERFEDRINRVSQGRAQRMAMEAAHTAMLGRLSDRDIA